MSTLTIDHMSHAWQANHGALVRYAARLLRCGEAGQDAAADTWVRASQSLHRFHGGGSVKSWLFAICHRLCLDRLRHGRVVRRHQDVVGELESLRSPADPEQRMSSRRQAERLSRALGELPETHRRVLSLRVVEGCSARETASRLGLSPHQVDSQLSYARRCLRQMVA